MEQIPILNEERIETTSPEAELWRAVIDQAIADLSDPTSAKAPLSGSNRSLRSRVLFGGSASISI
jgi:hypothetical protein